MTPLIARHIRGEWTSNAQKTLEGLDVRVPTTRDRGRWLICLLEREEKKRRGRQTKEDKGPTKRGLGEGASREWTNQNSGGHTTGTS